MPAGRDGPPAEVAVRPPVGQSAIYLHARQADGQEVWTSPLFITRDA